jgi:hypothetical protein
MAPDQNQFEQAMNNPMKIDNYRADNQKLRPDLPHNKTCVEVTLSLPSRQH